MSSRFMHPVVSVLAVGLIIGVGTGLTALPVRAAKSTTLHFYSVEQTLTAADAAGQTLSSLPPRLGVGEHYDSTDLYYVGNHKHHSSVFGASDHVTCSVTSATSQTCDQQIAIGSSLLLLNHVTLSTVVQTLTGPISAGTGKYKNAQGTVTSTNVGTTSNADIKIVLTSS